MCIASAWHVPCSGEPGEPGLGFSIWGSQQERGFGSVQDEVSQHGLFVCRFILRCESCWGPPSAGQEMAFKRKENLSPILELFLCLGSQQPRVSLMAGGPVLDPQCLCVHGHACAVTRLFCTQLLKIRMLSRVLQTPRKLASFLRCQVCILISTLVLTLLSSLFLLLKPGSSHGSRALFGCCDFLGF
jgi:hypothetical protein